MIVLCVFEDRSWSGEEGSTAVLSLAAVSACLGVVLKSFYAHQDVGSDKVAGVRSITLRFGANTKKVVLGPVATLQVALFASTGLGMVAGAYSNLRIRIALSVSERGQGHTHVVVSGNPEEPFGDLLRYSLFRCAFAKISESEHQIPAVCRTIRDEFLLTIYKKCSVELHDGIVIYP